MENGSLFRKAAFLLSLLTLPSLGAWVKVNDQIGFEAISVVTDKIVVASGYQSVYRSMDGGASWKNLGGGKKTCFLNDDSVIFAGSIGDGIWTSKDSGLTWKSLYTYQGNPNVYAIARIKNRLIAGTDGGVYVSDNDGLKWTHIRVASYDSVRTLATDGKVVLLTTNRGGGGYRSADTGKTWSNFPGISPRQFAILDGVYYGATENAGVVRSQDEGKTWTYIFLGSYFKHIDFLAVRDSVLFTGNSQAIFFSVDNGLNWTEFSDTGHPSTRAQMLVGDYIYYTPSVGPDYGEFRCSIPELFAKSLKESQGPDSTLWLQTKGPPGGEVTSFAEFNNDLFAGTVDGVYRAAAGGDSWVKVFKAGNALAANGNFLFAAGQGIFRTSDLKRKWTDINAGTGNYISTLRMIGTTLYAGGGMTGVYSSGFEGTSWWSEREGLESYGVTAFDTIGGQVWVGSTTGLFRKNDRNITVNGSSNPPDWIAAGLNSQIRCMASNRAKHFAGTAGGLYEMADTTVGWRLLTDAVLPKTEIHSLLVLGDTLYAGANSLFRSTDNGLTWKSILPSERNAGVRSLYAYRGTIFAGMNGGSIYRSGDKGETWSHGNAGLANGDIRCLKVFGGALYASDFSGRIYKSPDNGESWMEISAGLPPQANIFALETTANGLYAAIINVGVFQLNESGSGWDSRLLGLKDTTCTALGSIGNTLFVGMRKGGVYRFANPGAGWTAVGLSTLAINSLTSYGQTLYAATSKGYFHSEDNAETWTPGGMQEHSIRDLAAFGNTLVLAADSGLFRSTDHGITWTTKFQPYQFGVGPLTKIGSHLVTSVTDRSSSGNYRSTVYQSKDTGSTWVPADSGLYRDAYGSGTYAFAANGDYYFAATRDHGVWRRPLSYLGHVRIRAPGGMRADGLHLRIRPHGGRSHLVTLEFGIPRDERVFIHAFDMQGRRFDICAGRKFTSGSHSVRWYTQPLARGRFFVRLEAGSRSLSRSMVIE